MTVPSTAKRHFVCHQGDDDDVDDDDDVIFTQGNESVYNTGLP